MPFVDVTVIDASENPQGCPASYPEELIFEVWPGTMAVCDMLESEHQNMGGTIHHGRHCDKKGDVENGKRWHRKIDDYSVWGMNPIV